VTVTVTVRAGGCCGSGVSVRTFVTTSPGSVARPACGRRRSEQERDDGDDDEENDPRDALAPRSVATPARTPGRDHGS
jgi:hypothetical protein